MIEIVLYINRKIWLLILYNNKVKKVKKILSCILLLKRTELENWRINGKLDIFSCVYKILTRVPASFELDTKTDCTFMLGMR